MVLVLVWLEKVDKHRLECAAVVNCEWGCYAHRCSVVLVMEKVLIIIVRIMAMMMMMMMMRMRMMKYDARFTDAV